MIRRNAVVSGIAASILVAELFFAQREGVLETTSAAQKAAVSDALGAATTTIATPEKKTATPIQAENNATSTKSGGIYRLKDPYPFPASDPALINAQTREALVNILCAGTDSIQPTSGSGVLIDPRGIVLTNAHVAQYVLLSEDPRVDLTCTIRTGSPATPTWKAEVLYLPPQWIHEHATELNHRAVGTGEHDYALLRINAGIGTPLPQNFPFIPVDSREGIGFTDDTVLTASYPAEFTGGLLTQRELYAVTAWAKITELHTFNTGSVDAFSLSSTVGSQSGSSGGAVVNGWQKLMGIITTMSGGAETSERQLQAITTAGIDRDLKSASGLTLTSFLAQDLEQVQDDFDSKTAPVLVQELLSPLLK